jgi:hypothetical protein
MTISSVSSAVFAIFTPAHLIEFCAFRLKGCRRQWLITTDIAGFRLVGWRDRLSVTVAPPCGPKAAGDRSSVKGRSPPTPPGPDFPAPVYESFGSLGGDFWQCQWHLIHDFREDPLVG